MVNDYKRKIMSLDEFMNAKVYKKGNALMINDSEVMYYSEKETITERVLELCRKYKPKKVLEIGFGLGYTATAFQEYGIKEHIILEPQPKIFKKAVKWANKYQGNGRIQLIQSFIQDFKYDEKGYDLIFDDRCEVIRRFKDDEVTPRYKVRGLAGWGILNMRPINKRDVVYGGHANELFKEK